MWLSRGITAICIGTPSVQLYCIIMLHTLREAQKLNSLGNALKVFNFRQCQIRKNWGNKTVFACWNTNTFIIFIFATENIRYWSYCCSSLCYCLLRVKVTNYKRQQICRHRNCFVKGIHNKTICPKKINIPIPYSLILRS